MAKIEIDKRSNKGARNGAIGPSSASAEGEDLPGYLPLDWQKARDYNHELPDDEDS